MDQQPNMAEPAKFQTPNRFSSDLTMSNDTGMQLLADLGMEIKNEEGSLGRLGMPLLADVNMDGNNYIRTSSTTIEESCSTATSSFVEPVKVAEENLMDRFLYDHATTQGDDVDGFIKILKSISSENDQLEHSKILGRISPRGNTCLHIAASYGHHELAKYIVGQCPDVVNMVNSDDDTALHIAARRRDLPLVKILMNSCRGCLSSRDLEKAEADLLTLTNKEGNTVLHEALINHCKEEEVVEIIKLAKTHHDHPQLAYYLNNEGKSPLYLAAQANYFHVVEAIATSQPEEAIATSQPEEPIDNGATSQLEEPIDNGAGKAKPALHAAILAKNMVMLEKILRMKQLVHQKDKDGKTPLHCAASIGYLEGVQKLLESQFTSDRYERDNDGFCPIHVASMRGYVDIVKQLLWFSRDSKELLSRDDCENFLHVAAKFGADNIVDFVLKEKWIENLINEKDGKGNTPLHLATKYGHPKVVNCLTWDKRVDLNLVNRKGRTAFDIAVSVKHPTSFHQRLVWTALKSAGARSARESKDVPPNRRLSKTPNTEEYKDRVNTLLLVSTLVATVTFAAGFTMPGGYNSSNPNVGMAILLMKNMFHVFVICNTLAMYTAILATITLIWAQLGDLNLMDTALRFALSFLGVALTAMSLGFTAGVYLVVSNLHWLAIAVLSIGIICLVILFVPFLLLFLPSKNTNCILRYISYYPFLILVWASQSHEIKR